MNRPIILDAGPLGKIAHPKPNPQIAEWFKLIVGSGVEIIVAEVADYEVRRSLLLARLDRSVERLDELKQDLFAVDHLSDAEGGYVGDGEESGTTHC